MTDGCPDHLSVSQISMLMRCPMQYEWRYIKGVKAPYPVALAQGNAMHRVLQSVNSYFMLKKKWLKEADVADIWRTVWGETQKEVEDWGEESQESVLVSGLDLLRTYLREVADETVPVACEEFFDVKINGESVIGYIDLVEKDSVSDYKVVGRTPSQKDVENHMQLALYCIVKQVKLGQIIALNKKKQEVTVIPAKFNCKEWLGWFGDIIDRYAAMRKAGVFPPCQPDSWMCSEKFCGYYKQCRGASSKKKGVRIQYVQIGGVGPRKAEVEDE